MSDVESEYQQFVADLRRIKDGYWQASAGETGVAEGLENIGSDVTEKALSDELISQLTNASKNDPLDPEVHRERAKMYQCSAERLERWIERLKQADDKVAVIEEIKTTLQELPEVK